MPVTLCEKCIQPNAFDFTLDKVYKINHSNTFFINEEGKQMRTGSEHLPVTNRRTQTQEWVLEGDSVYDGMSDIYVQIPDGIAAMLITRSVFSRNGLFLTSGLYDSGYNGHIGFAIHNRSGPAHIGVGTRIGQIIFVEAENALQYAGQWNHEQGTHYTEKIQ